MTRNKALRYIRGGCIVSRKEDGYKVLYTLLQEGEVTLNLPHPFNNLPEQIEMNEEILVKYDWKKFQITLNAKLPNGTYRIEYE